MNPKTVASLLGYFIITIMVFLLKGIKAIEMRTGMFTLSPELETQAENLFDVESYSVIACGSLCLSNDECEAFAFDSVTSKCLGFSGRCQSKVTSLPSTTRLYKKQNEKDKEKENICEQKAEECLRTIRGIDYLGKLSTTSSGYTCQRWTSQTPHSHTFGDITDQENYCRNPDNNIRPWCYTTNPDIRWDYCNIPYCENAPECLSSVKGTDYVGFVNVTTSGKSCQRWDSQSPHSHSYHAWACEDNNCRNYDAGKDGPWCYTTDPNTEWELCNIPYCPDCLTSVRGNDYVGFVNVTYSGKSCQRWDSQSPHSHSYHAWATEDNYCRNSDDAQFRPWCYIADPNYVTQRESCSIPYCHNEECMRSSSGYEYHGKVNRTKDNIKCQRWDSQTPHSHRFTDLDGQENYCRNPDNEPQPWCYTTDPDVRFGVCNIPKCEHAAEECLRTPYGIDYFGNVSTTLSGSVCQRWDSLENPGRYIDRLSDQENYCRNPTNDWGPWCFTMNPDLQSELCGIPYCGVKLINMTASSLLDGNGVITTPSAAIDGNLATFFSSKYETNTYPYLTLKWNTIVLVTSVSVDKRREFVNRFEDVHVFVGSGSGRVTLCNTMHSPTSDIRKEFSCPYFTFGDTVKIEHRGPLKDSQLPDKAGYEFRILEIAEVYINGERPTL